MPTGIKGFLERFFWTIKSVRNIFTLIFDFLNLSNDKVIYFIRNGLKIVARAGTTDKSEIILIFSDKEYPKRFFPQNYKPVIIDIGSHIGCFSLYINEELKKNKPDIYSIEPSDENYNLLEENRTLNELNFKCFRLAISDYEGSGYLNKRGDFDSFYLKKTIPSKRGEFSQSTSVMTLENFCRQHSVQKIDLLKIDCEGEEYKIFKKSISFIKEKVKYIFAEVHNIDDKKNYLQFEKFVKENNFSVVYRMFPTVVFLKNLNL